jgi:hypothetical protein
MFLKNNLIIVFNKHNTGRPAAVFGSKSPERIYLQTGILWDFYSK